MWEHDWLDPIGAGELFLSAAIVRDQCGIDKWFVGKALGASLGQKACC